jgi:hypothetical protein
MSATSSVSAANCFIDLATFSELESFLYGGPLAISFFVAGVQKANWFSIIPIVLRNNGTFECGANGVSACLNRSGDYVLNVWFRCEWPTVCNRVGAQKAPADTVRWTRNLMHNVIKRCSITFNELVVQEFDNYWLDFNYMFRIPASKRIGYQNMIGDIAALTTTFNPAADPTTLNVNQGLLGGFFSVVLPFWFGEDSGVALPVAALPFNDVKINYEFRNATDLLVMRGNASMADLVSVKPGTDAATGQPYTTVTATGSVTFTKGYTHAHYAVIHNDERVKMGDAPRDMLIRQVQNVSVADVPASTTKFSFDLRLSHSIVSLFFAMRNKSQAAEWSNYTTNFDYKTINGVAAQSAQVQGGAFGISYWNPIQKSELIYENTLRLSSDSDFYALIHPYLFSDTVPDEVGYHMWTYSLRPWEALSPAGSTNYSKLANVTVNHDISNIAQYYLNNNLVNLGAPLKLSNVLVAQNWNIARVANGSLGHPTL